MSRAEQAAGSATVIAGQRRLFQRMGMQIEPDERRGGALVDRELVDVDGKDGEDVTMRLVAPRRAGPAIAYSAEIGPRLHAAWRRQAHFGVAGVARQKRAGARYVEND